MYWACSNMDGSPWPSKTGGTFSKAPEWNHWGAWKDETCFMQVNKGYIFTLLITIGFYTVDYIQ